LRQQKLAIPGGDDGKNEAFEAPCQGTQMRGYSR